MEPLWTVKPLQVTTEQRKERIMALNFLDTTFMGLERRIEVAQAIGCKPETIQALVTVRSAVLAVDMKIMHHRSERQKQRAEALGWSPCEIHAKYTKRPRIDCFGCQRANADTGPSDFEDLPGQG